MRTNEGRAAAERSYAGPTGTGGPEPRGARLGSGHGAPARDDPLAREDGHRPPALTLLVMHGIPGAGPCLCGTPEDPAGAGWRAATATRPTGAALREGWLT